MRVGHLSADDLHSVEAFYSTHGPTLRYPRAGWGSAHLREQKLQIIGIVDNKNENLLIAVAWIALKGHNIYLERIGRQLILRNDGTFADSGGWLIHPAYLGKGLFKLLTVAVLVPWFLQEGANGSLPLWGRMVGKRNESGVPFFWERHGEHITGLPYHELMGLPFGEMEAEILKSWPQHPIEMDADLQKTFDEVAGKSYGSLDKARERFKKWGLREVEGRFVPTSLNTFTRATRESALEDMRDLKRYYEQTLQEFA